MEVEAPATLSSYSQCKLTAENGGREPRKSDAEPCTSVSFGSGSGLVAMRLLRDAS